MEAGKGKENANRQKNMLDTVDFNHVQHISFTQSCLTDAVSVILSGLLSYEHPPNGGGVYFTEQILFAQRKKREQYANRAYI